MARIQPPKAEEVVSGPRSGLKMKKILLNDGDFLNEFKLNWTVNNFSRQLITVLIATVSNNHK